METLKEPTVLKLSDMIHDLSIQVSKIATDRMSKWHEGHDNLLRIWRKQAAINLWLQLASNYYYHKLNDCLSYPSIIISAATSIGVFGSDNSMVGKYAISILALMSGILTAVNKHCRAAEKSQEFALRAKDYYTFIREIDFILSICKDERKDMGETLERIRSTYDRIVDMQLEPPIHIVREYEKKFKPLEASLFDLSSEMRSRSSVEEPEPRGEPPGHSGPMNKAGPMANCGMDIEAMRNMSVKAVQNKIKDSIMSPYQLFSGLALRNDGIDMQSPIPRISAKLPMYVDALSSPRAIDSKKISQNAIAPDCNLEIQQSENIDITLVVGSRASGEQ